MDLKSEAQPTAQWSPAIRRVNTVLWKGQTCIANCFCGILKHYMTHWQCTEVQATVSPSVLKYHKLLLARVTIV